MSEAAGPLNMAVDGLLQADGALMAELGGIYIYSGEGPAQDASVADYIELGSDDTAPFQRFNRQDGEQPGIDLEVWSLIQRPGGTTLSGKGRVLELAGHVSRILNDRAFDLPGYGRWLGGRVTLLRTLKDPFALRMRAALRFQGYAVRATT